MLNDNIASRCMNQIFRRTKAQSTLLRKSDAAKRLDYYHDGQVEHIWHALQRDFANPRQHLRPCFANIVKKITNQLAMVYLQNARRSVDGPKRDAEIFQEIARSTRLGAKMKQANRYAKLLKTIMIRPVWRNGRMDLDVLPGDILDVECGATPEELKSVLVTYYGTTDKPEDVTYSAWDCDEWRRLDYRGRIIEQGDNPYGVVPFVPVWDRMPTDSFWLTGGDDLMTLQESVNERLTDLQYVLRMQGFGVGWVRGLEDRDRFDTVGPGTMVSLPTGGDLGYAATQAPIADILASIEFLLKQAAITNGLPAASMSLDPTDESGIARIAGNRELEELRRDDIDLFRGYERGLFDLFRIIWNVHQPGRKFSEAATLTVDFYDPTPTLSPDKQAALWASQIDLGLASPVDIMQQLNPDLSREDAKARLYEIRDENKEFSEYDKL